MKHIGIGTAGHIDHGKSALVLALTGTDPDRLKEEKARGITIDLGFANLRDGDSMIAVVGVMAAAFPVFRWRPSGPTRLSGPQLLRQGSGRPPVGRRGPRGRRGHRMRISPLPNPARRPWA